MQKRRDGAGVVEVDGGTMLTLKIRELIKNLCCSGESSRARLTCWGIQFGLGPAGINVNLGGSLHHAERISESPLRA